MSLETALHKLRICDVNIGAWLSGEEAEALLAERDALRLALERIADLHSSEDSDPDTFEQARAALGRKDAPWENRFESDLAEAEGRVAVLEAALREIAEQDWVENVLDPQWAARIAGAVLAGGDAAAEE